VSDIRVTHSGVINLLTGFARVATAFIFIIFITRNLSPEEFGQYNLVLSMITYVVVSHWIISYWNTRDIARGNSSGRTAIISGGMFSIIGFLVFIIIGLSVDSKIDVNVIILAGFLVPLQFLHQILNNTSVGWKPQIASYGNLFLELTRVPFGVFFLFILNMKLDGVFLSVIISYIVSITLMLYFNRGQLQDNFSCKLLKNWLSRFWISVYPAVATMVSKFDLLVVALLSSTSNIGFYSAAFSVGTLVLYANLISVGVYPKLLGSDRGKYLSDNFRLLLYVSILFTTVCIVFAKSILYVLNPIYGAMAIPVIFISLRCLLGNIFDNFNLILRGTETIDEKENPTFKEIVTSKLFKLPTIQLFHRVSYIVILAVTLFLIKFSSTLDLVIFWSGVSLAAQIPATLAICLWIRKEKIIQVNIYSILKYIFTGIVIYFLVDYLHNNFINYMENVVILGLKLLLLLGMSILLYVFITFVIDKSTRQLVTTTIRKFL